MAATIDETIGSASANAYCDVAYADAYHEEKLHVEVWDTADPATVKTPAIIWATRLIDEYFAFFGQVVSEDQALQWPREYAYDRNKTLIDDSIIPVEVKDATAELARHLISSDPQAEYSLSGFKEIKVSSITLKADKRNKASTIPDSVKSILRYLTLSSTGVAQRTLVRV